MEDYIYDPVLHAELLNDIHILNERLFRLGAVIELTTTPKRVDELTEEYKVIFNEMSELEYKLESILYYDEDFD